MNFKVLAAGSICLALSACLTLSGNYRLTARDAAGEPILQNMHIMAQGSGIYQARNGICAAFPRAVVTITDTDTGKELTSESPYRCR